MTNCLFCNREFIGGKAHKYCTDKCRVLNEKKKKMDEKRRKIRELIEEKGADYVFKQQQRAIIRNRSVPKTIHGSKSKWG